MILPQRENRLTTEARKTALYFISIGMTERTAIEFAKLRALEWPFIQRQAFADRVHLSFLETKRPTNYGVCYEN